MWFTQDGATPHRANEVFDLLEEHFNGRIVDLGYPKSENMGIDWPPYSPDLNPCDSFFVGLYQRQSLRWKPPEHRRPENCYSDSY
ncbi:hypothetical protein AVEN_48542-1 [Araneus ventricosus]|uniref:Tc1-like transposase DDE domain-containing protein n=1 Tax=Araneus ventricosus TaxID=182803 RepID=A0A4Y2AED8_ARAVE|nr:hypothetical protein AVEN_48542-1 [Araneus ventricosus]